MIDSLEEGLQHNRKLIVEHLSVNNMSDEEEEESDTKSSLDLERRALQQYQNQFW